MNPFSFQTVPRIVMETGAMQQTRLLMNNPRELLLADALGIYQRAF